MRTNNIAITVICIAMTMIIISACVLNIEQIEGSELGSFKVLEETEESLEDEAKEEVLEETEVTLEESEISEEEAEDISEEETAEEASEEETTEEVSEEEVEEIESEETEEIISEEESEALEEETTEEVLEEETTEEVLEEEEEEIESEEAEEIISEEESEALEEEMTEEALEKEIAEETFEEETIEEALEEEITEKIITREVETAEIIFKNDEAVKIEIEVVSGSEDNVTEEISYPEESSEDIKPQKSVYNSEISSSGEKYVKQVSKVMLTEKNVNGLSEESLKISVSKDGKVLELEPEKDYSVSGEEDEDGTQVYTYKINEDVFSEDGTYRITTSSVDSLGESNSNVDEDAEIVFCVDKTEPAIIMLEGNSEDKNTVELLIKDNIKLNDVHIYLGSREMEYTENEGHYYFDIPDESEESDLRIVAGDAAGNVVEKVIKNYAVGTASNSKSPVGIIFIIAGLLALNIALFVLRKSRSFKLFIF